MALIESSDNTSLYACSGDCDISEIYNCHLYLGIADAYVEYGQMGNTNCMEQTLTKLKIYGMGFWLLHTQTGVDFMSNLTESLPETCCICTDCDFIKCMLRHLGENCHPISSL